MRTRDDLVHARVSAGNQLATLLDAHWPGAKVVFAALWSPISLAFLTRYPTPADATSLGEKRLAAFLAWQGYSGNKPAAVLLARLRQAIVTFAANSRFASPWVADIHDRARASGKDHQHATRVLARARTRVIRRCRQNHTPYDPELHGGAQRLTNQAAAT